MLSLYTNVMIRLRSEEKGATAVEYGIMVALIAVVIIVAVTLLGTTLSDTFSNIQCNVSGHGNWVPAAGTTVGACSAP
jgi:pilus assembly protein Flp/PilA